MEMMLQTGTKPVSPCGRFLCFVPAPDGPPTFRHGAALYRPLSQDQLSNAALASTVTGSSPAEREGFRLSRLMRRIHSVQEALRTPTMAK